MTLLELLMAARDPLPSPNKVTMPGFGALPNLLPSAIPGVTFPILPDLPAGGRARGVADPMENLFFPRPLPPQPGADVPDFAAMNELRVSVPRVDPTRPAPDPGPMRRPAPPLFPSGAPQDPSRSLRVGQVGGGPVAGVDPRIPGQFNLPAYQRASAPGAMRAPIKPGEARKSRGPFGGAIGRLLAGADDPNLSRAENDEIRRQAFIDAGLGLLAGSSSTEAVPGFTSAVGSGILFANERAAAGRSTERQENELEKQKALAEKQLRFRSAVLSNVDLSNPHAMQQAMLMVAATGDAAGLKALVDISGTIQPSQFIQGQRGQILHANPMTGDFTVVQAPEDMPVDRDIRALGADETGVFEDGVLVKRYRHNEYVSAAAMRDQMRDDYKFELDVRQQWNQETGKLQSALAITDVALAEAVDIIGPNNEILERIERGNGAVEFNTLVTGLAKVLDEGSTVREEEAKRTAAVGSIMDNIENAIKRGLSGEVKGELFNKLRRELQAMQQSMVNRLNDKATPIVNRADQLGYNVDVIIEPGFRERIGVQRNVFLEAGQ
jgi:hypothetical protein